MNRHTGTRGWGGVGEGWGVGLKDTDQSGKTERRVEWGGVGEGVAIWALQSPLPQFILNQTPHCHAIALLLLLVVVSRSNATAEEGMLGSHRTQCSEPAREQSTLMWDLRASYETFPRDVFLHLLTFEVGEEERMPHDVPSAALFTQAANASIRSLQPSAPFSATLRNTKQRSEITREPTQIRRLFCRKSKHLLRFNTVSAR